MVLYLHYVKRALNSMHGTTHSQTYQWECMPYHRRGPSGLRHCTTWSPWHSWPLYTPPHEGAPHPADERCWWSVVQWFASDRASIPWSISCLSWWCHSGFQRWWLGSLVPLPGLKNKKLKSSWNLQIEQEVYYSTKTKRTHNLGTLISSKKKLIRIYSKMNRSHF